MFKLPSLSHARVPFPLSPSLPPSLCGGKGKACMGAGAGAAVGEVEGGKGGGRGKDSKSAAGKAKKK